MSIEINGFAGSAAVNTKKVVMPPVSSSLYGGASIWGYQGDALENIRKFRKIVLVLKFKGGAFFYKEVPISHNIEHGDGYEYMSLEFNIAGIDGSFYFDWEKNETGCYAGIGYNGTDYYGGGTTEEDGYFIEGMDENGLYITKELSKDGTQCDGSIVFLV